MTLKIHAETLKSWLSDKDEIAFIDVREIGQHTKGHPFFSISIPYSLFELNLEILIPNKKTKMILLDQNDDISILAYKEATLIGYSNIFILEEGVNGWINYGYKLFDGINVPSKSFGELIEKHFHTPSITAKELNEKQKNNENCIVIDGRPFDEYQNMSIPNSICCPNGELAYSVSSHVKDINTEIIINCAGRTRSIIGAQTLIDLGISNKVKALENGTQGWFLSDLCLDHNKNDFLDVRPDDTELKKIQNKIFKLLIKHSINLIDFSKAQELILDKNKSTFIFNVTNSNKNMNSIRHVPGGQLVQATDKYIGVWKATVILVDDGDLIRAGTTAIWLKKMGYQVHVLKKEININKLKFKNQFPLKEKKINIFEIEKFNNFKNTILYDIRSSENFMKIRIKNSIWLNRANLRKVKIKKQQQIIIITDEFDKARLVINDIEEMNLGCVISLYKWKENELINHSNIIDNKPILFPKKDCIDFNFHTYKRHKGSKSHANQYLKWEIGLINKMDKQELSFFNIF
ncbi:MAG: rhodanese-like domain-containing protein [Pelagibacterales bacterium]